VANFNNLGHWCRRRRLVASTQRLSSPGSRCTLFESLANSIAVKFDTAKLPPILNSLQTENNGQKLVLEVAVCYYDYSMRIDYLC
jgi:hypothetical protein